MEVYVLDTNFTTVGLIDDFESIIWTDRYQSAGDFEIYTSANSRVKDIALLDYYLYYANSDHMMIIEGHEISSDVEDGNKFIITGRSLESILDRRIIWNQTTISGNLQNGIKKLITDAIIAPTDSTRKISNFIFKDSTDPNVTSITIEATQYTGDNLYDVICQLCVAHEIGFKITLDDSFNFVFELYSGVNRSYDQTEVPYVVFSPNYENIINSDFIENKTTYKNVTLVAGEEEGNNRKTYTVGTDIGLVRRELYTDARDISSTEGDITYSAAQYNEMLKARGEKNLNENKIVKTFSGEVETSYLFVYKEDFYLGDTVQVINDYGNESKSRVTEMIISQSTEGFSEYPTFEILDEEETKS